MKKSLLILFLLLFSAVIADAQILRLECYGEALPQKYMSRITRTLTKEVEFYGPLGLQDTVYVKLRVYKDMDSANEFIRNFVPNAYGQYAAGVFIKEIETAVIHKETDIDAAVKTLFHEINHFLFSKAMEGAPIPSMIRTVSLNEGLSSYFQFLNVKPDGTAVQKHDKARLAMVKSLFEIDEFNIDEYLAMTHVQFIDKARHNGIISYAVSYAIVCTLFDRLDISGMRNLLGKIRDGATYEKAVSLVYPGGKTALAEDICAYVNKNL